MKVDEIDCQNGDGFGIDCQDSKSPGMGCSSLVPALRVVITAVPVRILIFLLVAVKAMEYKDIFIYYKNVVKPIYFFIMNCTTSNNHND